MCGSMADIQSPTTEIRRGKKKKKPQGKNIMSASATQCGHNELLLIGWTLNRISMMVRRRCHITIVIMCDHLFQPLVCLISLSSVDYICQPVVTCFVTWLTESVIAKSVGTTSLGNTGNHMWRFARHCRFGFVRSLCQKCAILTRLS